MATGQMERVLFDRAAGVLVTTARAEFGATTYAVSQIVSVTMEKVKPDRGTAILLAFLAFATAAFGVMLEAAVLVGLGAVLAAAGIAWAVTRKAKYVVRILTGGSTVDAFSTENGDIAAQVSVAIKNAITGRG